MLYLYKKEEFTLDFSFFGLIDSLPEQFSCISKDFSISDQFIMVNEGYQWKGPPPIFEFDFLGNTYHLTLPRGDFFVNNKRKIWVPSLILDVLYKVHRACPIISEDFVINVYKKALLDNDVNPFITKLFVYAAKKKLFA